MADSASTFESSITTLTLPNCVISDISYKSTVEIDAGIIDSAYLLHIGLAGDAETLCGKRRLLSSPGTIVVSSPSIATQYSIAGGARNITLRIPRRQIEKAARQMFFFSEHRPVEFNCPTTTTSEFGVAIVELLRHIFLLALRAPAALKSACIQQTYADLIAQTLLSLLPHSYTGHPIGGNLSESPVHLRRAIRYIDSSLADIRTIRQIAEAVGVSERYLQSSFRQWLRQSPAEFVREHRLVRLHADLADARLAAWSVLDLMLRWGIGESGRYAGYYQHRFGESPSVTRRKSLRPA